jgi:RND family efflux transporter MFP subunit
MSKEGEMCGPGTPIVQIVNSSSLKIVAQVPETFLGKVKVGDAVEIDFPALETKQNGRVIKIGRMINSANRTFEVEASVDSKGGQIKPNLLATMLIQDYGKPKAISLPDDLIMQDVDGNSYVMLVKDDKASKRTVTLGKSYKNETVIETGLDGNETLIIKGARQVVEGDEVKVLTEVK